MTYLLEANKTPELSWASRHKSRLQFSRRVRCWGEREENISSLLCKLLFACSVAVKLDNAVPGESNRCCKCQRLAMVAWGQNMTRCVVLLSAGQGLWQLMPSPGVWANIYRLSFVLYSEVFLSSDPPNLKGAVNQENLSPLPSSLCEVRVSVTAKLLSISGRYVSHVIWQALDLQL